MKVAVLQEQGVEEDVRLYIPKETTTIICGDGLGVWNAAENYADQCGLPKLVIQPPTPYPSTAALLRCNKMMIDCADMVLVLWRGKSAGLKQSIEYAKNTGKIIGIYEIKE